MLGAICLQRLVMAKLSWAVLGMFNLKKAMIAFMIVFNSHAMVAGTMGTTCTSNPVKRSCLPSWDFSIDALYLKPSYAGLDYLGSRSVNGRETFDRLDHDWGLGFKVAGAYHTASGNDLNFHWYHYAKTTTLFPGDQFTSFTGQRYDTDVHGRVKPEWDAVNLEFGQSISLGRVAAIRFHRGAQFARVYRSFIVTASGLDYTSATGYSAYNGIGPRMGVDMSYDYGYGLKFYANTGTALLIGGQDFSRTLMSAMLDLTSQKGSAITLIPELEMDLGVTYIYAMTQSYLSLNAGWMWINYFDVQQNNIRDGLTKESNVSFQGPYLGVKWTGNIG